MNDTNTAHDRRPSNRLAREKSPYLLQHAHNPVDWHAWGEEAFEKARQEDKPILLSIGYSTCHWCHVMEREAFENEQIGGFLNEHFVSIKVDREERPDVDKIYMTAVQAMGQGGGWPLNTFLTPSLKPFFGGTYWPPEPKYGRPSFLQILQKVVQIWQQQRSEIEDSANDGAARLAEMIATEPDEKLVLAPAVLKNALAAFKADFEPRFGGFGGAPKFPRPTVPSFVLSQGIRDKDRQAVEMVLFTCERMAAGGMNDQLGGGFARYSVDERWLVPHFEKMLYDNAQLVNLYLDVWLVSGKEEFADVARATIDYVLRDMTHPEGGFYSAEDADSEGHEGKFYCWTKKEIGELLSPEEAAVVIRHYGITEDGNFTDHSHPSPLPDQNVLSVVDPELTPEEETLLAGAKEKMFAVRGKRVRPHLDDKVLGSWNGLMLGAMARAGAVLREARYLEAAQRNLTFLRDTLWDPETNTLYHRWRDGERDTAQLLDAYAFLLGGVVDLYGATLDSSHLEFALELAGAMIQRFYDPENGGFFQSPPADDLILRVKEDYDGAEPSGNSVAILSLLQLAALTGKPDFREIAERSLRLFAERLQRFPQAVPLMLTGVQRLLDEPTRIVITGEPGAEDRRALLAAAHSVHLPNKVVLSPAGPVEEFAKSLPVEERARAFICTGTECREPVTDAEELRKALAQM